MKDLLDLGLPIFYPEKDKDTEGKPIKCATAEEAADFKEGDAAFEAEGFGLGGEGHGQSLLIGLGISLRGGDHTAGAAGVRRDRGKSDGYPS